MKTAEKLVGLRPRRVALGLTQQQLADQLGITQPRLCLWETGQSWPPAALLPRLSEALHCSIDELFVPESGTGEVSSA